MFIGDDTASLTTRNANRFSARAARYARVGANVGGVAARIAGARLSRPARSTAAGTPPSSPRRSAA